MGSGWRRAGHAGQGFRGGLPVLIGFLCASLLAPGSPGAGRRAEAGTNPIQEPLRKLAPLEEWLDGCFATSAVCARCHSNSEDATALRDNGGRPVSPYDLWRSSMMANSARDPLWRAAVSVEMAMHPGQRDAIQAKCMRCHTPAASVEKRHAGSPLTLEELYDADARYNQLALDGVSCTVCHQIEPDGLGQRETFSGHFKIASKGILYGPHEDPLTMPMVRQTGFRPRHGEHISESSLCGSCHTLETRPFDAAGKPTDHVFVEQSPYLEWRNSAFNDEVESPAPEAASCQDCHVPTADVDGTRIRTNIARNPMGADFPFIGPRDPFGRHVFVGGNTLIPAILRDNADTLKPNAPREAFDATIAAARRQLRESTARLHVERLGGTADRVRIGVRVENLTGHKFPTAHPTRRAWLRLRLVDSQGKRVLGWGEHDGHGRIVAADGALLPSERLGGGFQPHHQVIRGPNQVQIYESVLGDTQDDLTFGLMSAARYLKDNRLLPKGWQSDHPDAAATAPAGLGGDADFGPGRDTTEYQVPVPAQRADLMVEVTLFYQTLGGRYAQELLKWDTPEVREFRSYYQSADRTPEIVAQATLALTPRRSF